MQCSQLFWEPYQFWYWYFLCFLTVFAVGMWLFSHFNPVGFYLVRATVYLVWGACSHNYNYNYLPTLGGYKCLGKFFHSYLPQLNWTSCNCIWYSDSSKHFGKVNSPSVWTPNLLQLKMVHCNEFKWVTLTVTNIKNNQCTSDS